MQQTQILILQMNTLTDQRDFRWKQKNYNISIIKAF